MKVKKHRAYGCFQRIGVAAPNRTVTAQACLAVQPVLYVACTASPLYSERLYKQRSCRRNHSTGGIMERQATRATHMSPIAGCSHPNQAPIRPSAYAPRCLLYKAQNSQPCHSNRRAAHQHMSRRHKEGPRTAQLLFLRCALPHVKRVCAFTTGAGWPRARLPARSMFC